MLSQTNSMFLKTENQCYIMIDSIPERDENTVEKGNKC